MDFRLSDDQRAFAESASALFREHCTDDALRAHDQSGATFQQDLWRACVELGLHTIVVPEAHGGLGLGMTELMGVLEAQGRALALVPLWEHQLAAAALARFGADDAAGDVLRGAMAGATMLTLSLAPLDDPRGASLRLARAGGGWRLDGRAAAVPLGSDAAHALLAAECEGAARLVLLDLAHAGVRRVPGVSQRHLGTADVVADAVALDDRNVLAAAAHAWLEPRAIAALASLQAGVTAEQLARTVAYVSERKQFGRAIGTFQLVAGQLADAQIKLEALRSALWQLVYRLDAGLGTQPQAAATRVWACETGHFAGHRAQHMHGGVGVDVSHPMHRFLFWSRALAADLGGSEVQLERLGGWLASHDRLGWKYDLPEDTLT